MELIKGRDPLEFKHHDATFLVKAEASEGDRLEVRLSGRYENGQYVFGAAEFNRALVKRMVLGWKGVTQDGKDVAYSFDLLDRNFPITGKSSVLELLGNFIVEKTGIFKDDELIKNDSRKPATGHSK